MKLNCKNGELAVVVHANDKAILGAMVRCIELCPLHTKLLGIPIWEVEPLSPALRPCDTVAPDMCLRPIRDQPGTDETLTWLDVPTKETA